MVNQTKGQLICVVSEGWLVWTDTKDELPSHADPRPLLKTKTIRRYQYVCSQKAHSRVEAPCRVWSGFLREGELLLSAVWPLPGSIRLEDLSSVCRLQIVWRGRGGCVKLRWAEHMTNTAVHEFIQTSDQPFWRRVLALVLGGGGVSVPNVNKCSMTVLAAAFACRKEGCTFYFYLFIWHSVALVYISGECRVDVAGNRTVCVLCALGARAYCADFCFFIFIYFFFNATVRKGEEGTLLILGVKK